ncbi:hypothetical protein [Methylorubrum extorquens]|nr:hypothetical protein [Methylorubrum extorquens]
MYDAAGNPLSIEGRVFEAWIAPAQTKQGVAEPVEEIKVLTFQDGLTLVPPTDGSGDQTVKNTLVHQVSRAFAQAKFPRGELTADLLEVVGNTRRLFAPVRLFYADPAQIREFVADRAGITFGQGRQPIVTPVAIAGQAGRRGAGFITGTLAPQPSDGEDGDYFVVEREGQANLVYGPKENGEWPPQPSSTFGVGGIADVPGLPGVLAEKVSLDTPVRVDPDAANPVPAKPLIQFIRPKIYLQDYARADTDTFDNARKIYETILGAASLKQPLVGSPGPWKVDGPIKVASGLEFSGEGDFRIFQTGYGSFTDPARRPLGSFISNKVGIAGSYVCTGLRLDNIKVDQSLIAPVFVTAARASTSNTVQLGTEASSVDGFYVGLYIECVSFAGDVGTAGVGGVVRTVTAYNGATRVATVSPAWTLVPDVGATIAVGWNDNAFGFATGLSDAELRDCAAYNFGPAVPSVSGGKGINFEQGCDDCRVFNFHAEDCAGAAVFTQGYAGAGREAVNIEFVDISAKRCGAAAIFAGIDATKAPDGDPNTQFATLRGGLFEDCGHFPHRVVSGDHGKFGVIGLLEAQNISVSQVKIKNRSTYPNVSPGYPTGATRHGQGQSGPIGAVIHGHGRNCRFTDIEYHGDCDTFLRVARGRAAGDDGPGASVGKPLASFRIELANCHHYGTAQTIFDVDPSSVVRVDPDQVSAAIDVRTDTLTVGIVSGRVASLYPLIYMAVSAHTPYRRVEGLAADIYARGNTLSAIGVPAGATRYVTSDGFELIVERIDTAGTWTFPPDVDEAEFEANGGGGGGGSGRVGAAGTIRASGGSGGAGARNTRVFAAAEFPNRVVTLDIGLGGAGGAPVSTPDTNGLSGSTGGSTTIRAGTAAKFVGPGGGPGGGGGTTAVGAGTAGQNLSESLVGAGLPSNLGATAVGGMAGLRGAGGGGVGGGISAGNVSVSGGAGGIGTLTNGAPLRGGIGVSGAVGNNGGDGSSSPDPSGGGGGGGGGGAGLAAGGNAGNGGNGKHGSGGGSGGAATNGSTSGAGGRGGDGFVAIRYRRRPRSV